MGKAGQQTEHAQKCKSVKIKVLLVGFVRWCDVGADEGVTPRFVESCATRCVDRVLRP